MIQKINELEKKITDHKHQKYIPTPEFNKLTAENFVDFDAKLSSLDKKITSNKTKNLLVENELKKLKTFDFSYFRGKSHFEEDGTQNYLVFQPINKYFKTIAGVDIYYCLTTKIFIV